MRKIVTLSMVAVAAFAVSACGKTESTNTTDANAMVTEMNSSEVLEGTTNDSMTNTDGAMGASDNMMGSNAMGSNSMGSSSMNSANAMMPAGNASNAM